MPAGGKRLRASAATVTADIASRTEPTILRCRQCEMGAIPLVAAPRSQLAQAMTEQPTIIIVDDDPGIREALGSLIRSVGVQARALASVPEFLDEGRPDGPTCLVLDVRLPGRSGLDFQRELAAAKIHVPIIFITGYGDIPMSVQAMKGGAIEFLTKPFRDQDLLDAIELGLARDRVWLENERAIAALRACFETLTPREREVMALVVTGRLNKQIAYDIGISEITVKVHRGQVMRKMQATSLPDLARMADKLNIRAEKLSSW
ncbi:MAG TPA: response regulator transcription factor [Stellaceae bacterium]|jgi:FixJ family two-component response regulator